MRAHLVQPDIVWEDPEANFEAIDTLLDGADISPGDLIVLPEMYAVGFSLNIDRTAASAAATLRHLERLADDFGATVQGGRPVRDCHCAHGDNRMTAVGPDGALLSDYSKIHPFSFGREPEAFVGGRAVSVYDWTSGGDTLRVMPSVCYDLRFPELYRAGLAMGAEVLALGANWPDARMSHWRALCIARAIENQAFVLASNRTGPDPHLNYVGGTIAVSPTGDVLGELGDMPGVLSVGIEPRALHEWRTTFPAWKDARMHIGGVGGE